ncbi:MAG: SIS domain-containing protein [Desulfomonilaceae bacterium]
MCGIAGFVSNGLWQEVPDLSWIDSILNQMEALWTDPGRLEEFDRPLKELVSRFDDLMSFGCHMALIEGEAAAVLPKMERLADLLNRVLGRTADLTASQGRTDALEQLEEDARDCLWQIKEEVLGNVVRTANLLPGGLATPNSGRARHLVAWAVEQVMENIDRLEVRGRDSAGIAIQCLLLKNADLDAVLGRESQGNGPCAETLKSGAQRIISTTKLADARISYTFIYKIANLVGRLGDNTSRLRDAIRGDKLLWKIAALTEQVNIIAHTRWASNGIISLSNCHPVDGCLCDRDHLATIEDTRAQFVLNGDVDNYQTLMDAVVRGEGYEIDPLITTDTKILPLLYRLGTDPAKSPEDRFAAVLNACEGSMAVVMQHPHYPRTLFLGQKGSGQSLFVGKLNDGFMFASEVYGLAARTRRSYSLSGTERGGTQVVLTVGASDPDRMIGRYLEDGQPFGIKGEPIYIHSRDIFRGSYNYYFEKEIHEAPSSIRKTIRHKYRRVAGRIDFSKEGSGSFSRLLGRLRDPELPPIKRIMVIGQGTASVAAMGAAHLIDRALGGSRISIDWRKSSEMSGFLSEKPLSDMLLIAISQSGTTTDTNRTVDVAGSQGAWIHAIVNRRNSPLVAKSNSHFYTSDGRDVEMAVASTKAFYSQIAAAKLTALLLAQEFSTLAEEEIYEEIQELERLPGEIESVLMQCDSIKESAEKYGPANRNWAVVGNGPNKIAADEIRIKLSELCYKSIPCDFTEDKKHIDLSTEPLTLVVANDLPEQLVQDTVKEVAIFKAHNGKPLVLCARGEQRFKEHAERLIELPTIGAGLGFVLATVAGHLWGFYAAKAIDATAEDLRNVRSVLAKALEEPDGWDPDALRSKLGKVMKLISSGEMNASLPASTVAALAFYSAGLEYSPHGREVAKLDIEEGITILNRAIEDMTRPIDTIRHQAKTVTVGISRPQEVLPPVLLSALEQLSVLPGHIREQDRRLLRTVSPLIVAAQGGLLYKIIKATRGAPGSDRLWIQVTDRFGMCVGKTSRYDRPKPAGGSKRTTLRVERAVWSSGPDGSESLLLLPLFDEEVGEGNGVVLFHLIFAEQAPIQQKMAVLRALGTRYHDVMEWLEEVSNSRSLEEVLAIVSPRDLILAPVDSLVPRGSK